MAEPFPTLLKDILRADAAELVAARTKGRLLHRTKDIDAAGDEVEMATRQVLRRKLPSAYYVGHGHIVDEGLRLSGQLDVVIADNTVTPVLLRSANGTEYFPYEAVYAVGEVKTTYRKGHIDEFSRKLVDIRTNLHRERTSPLHAPPTFELQHGRPVLRERPFCNPLFSFMLFVDKGDFNEQQLIDTYASAPVERLPNILCFLNDGVVVNANLFGAHESGHPLRINVIPEFNREGYATAFGWTHMRATDEDQLAYSFGVLFYF